MSTSVPEGWTISEYKSFKATGDTDSSTDGDSSDDEQIFSKAKTKTFVKKNSNVSTKKNFYPNNFLRVN